jgi:hypothetical protein
MNFKQALWFLLVLSIWISPILAEQNQNPHFFLQAQAHNLNPYVQEQVILTLQLYTQYPILSSGLPTPVIDNAIIKKLGKDKEFQTQKNGKNYYVLERNYAMFPQIAGDLVIPSLNFSGIVLAKIKSDEEIKALDQSFKLKDYWVNIATPSLVLQVKPKPASFSGHWWLPSSHVSLQQSWFPQPPQFRVGETVTRNISLTIPGILAEQLPAVDIPSTPKFNAYPDKPEIRTQINENGVISSRKEKIAFVPNQAGKITLPAVKIHWWNTRTNKSEVAILPEETITVMKGIGYSKTDAPVSAPTKRHAKKK